MPPIFLQTRYQSAYSLLGAMATQLAGVLREAGHDVHEPDPANPPAAGTFLFFNTPPTLDAFPPALLERDSDLRAVQIFVDHPFALPATVLDAWRERNGLANLRLLLPCADDTHLLAPRFPGLRHAWLPHAIPDHALCAQTDLDRWTDRPVGVVVAGSIHTEAEINRTLSSMPEPSQRAVREAAALMLRDPGLGYVQAADLTDPSPRTWAEDQRRWRATNMIVNRVRRTGVVRALHGIDTEVYGPDAWKPLCTGTVRYAGNADYADVHRALARARMAVAWGPTQFAHSYSERLMLAMGAGCAAVSDDRLLVRRDFANLCAIYNAGDPATARAACEHLLANPDRAQSLARAGRAHAERSCLWRHRVDSIIEPSSEPVTA